MSAVLLLPLMLAAATPLSYPATAVVANFKASCAVLDTMEHATAAAQQAGWQVITAEPGMQVKSLVDFGEDMAKTMMSDDPSFKTDSRIMRQTIDGRDLFLVLSQVKSSASNSLGCRVYDFAATTKLDDVAVATLTDKAPSAKAEVAGVVSSRTWEPGLFPGHAKTQVGFVPQDSGLKQALHLSGINLMSQTMEVGN
jgi:hypothetical protein